MKLSKIAAGVIFTSSALFATAVQAATPGFYLGAQVGAGRAYEGDTLKNIYQSFSSYKISEGGISGRILAGFNFNQYFGLEGGYTKFANNSYTAYAIYNTTYKTSAFDVVGKGYLPLDLLTDTLSEKINLYGKVGLAYVMHKADTSINLAALGTLNNSNSKNNVRPTYGVGASYNFTKNFLADISWTQIQGKGDLVKEGFDNFSPKTNLLALGVSYAFG